MRVKPEVSGSLKGESLVVDIGGVRTWLHCEGKGPIHVWNYGLRYYMSGIGRMHAQEGFPMAMSLDKCAEFGIIPCFTDMAVDLRRCGHKNPVGGVEEAINDMAMPWPDSWNSMYHRFRETFYGRPKGPAQGDSSE